MSSTPSPQDWDYTYEPAPDAHLEMAYEDRFHVEDDPEDLWLAEMYGDGETDYLHDEIF